MSFPSLNQILTYKHSGVIERYKREHPNNRLNANEAFVEMLKFLWCAEKHRFDKDKNKDNQELDFNFYMHNEMKEIDDMWHIFILFTYDYTSFGETYFGHYVHHNPTTELEREKAKEEPLKLELELEKQLAYIYENLGQSTLEKWFEKCLV